MIIWFTGIPCSGKTTIAKALIEKIGAQHCELLDGDVLRGSNFAKGVGFDKADRNRHLLRVGYMAERLSPYAYVLCSFVSPYEDTRNQLNVDYMIYVECSPEVCEHRDVKGMWAKAKAGEISGFTGYDAPYEPPANPDLVLNTTQMSIDQCVEAVLELIGFNEVGCGCR